MWCTYARGDYFTAGNTTTNRLEATWKQMKRLVNLTSTLDQCLSGILLYQNASMRELRSAVIQKSLESHFSPRIPIPLRTIINVVGNYEYDIVHDEYLHYEHLYDVGRLELLQKTEKHVTVQEGNNELQVEFQDVEQQQASCPCIKYSTQKLPCVHIMFVILDVLGRDRIPVEIIPSRWNLRDIPGLAGALKTMTQCNKKLRELTWNVRNSGSVTSPHFGTPLAESTFALRTRIKFTKLKIGEHAMDCLVVKSDTEKYNIAMALFEPIIHDMVMSSSLNFYKLLDVANATCRKLRPVLTAISTSTEVIIDSDAVVSDPPPLGITSSLSSESRKEAFEQCDRDGTDTKPAKSGKCSQSVAADRSPATARSVD